MMRTGLLALGLAAALGGCGFTPAYAPVKEFAGASAIRIPEIEGRTGHFLRQELMHSVGGGVPGAPAASDLSITLKEAVTFVGYRPDQAASRADYVASATWVLKGSDGAKLAAGQSNESASFNFADSPYNDTAAQTGAKERVARALARTIRLDIMRQIGSVRPASAAPAPPPAPLPALGPTSPIQPQTVR